MIVISRWYSQIVSKRRCSIIVTFLNRSGRVCYKYRSVLGLWIIPLKIMFTDGLYLLNIIIIKYTMMRHLQWLAINIWIYITVFSPHHTSSSCTPARIPVLIENGRLSFWVNLSLINSEPRRVSNRVKEEHLKIRVHSDSSALNQLPQHTLTSHCMCGGIFLICSLQLLREE